MKGFCSANRHSRRDRHKRRRVRLASSISVKAASGMMANETDAG